MPIEQERRGDAFVMRLRGSFYAGERAEELGKTLERIVREGRGSVVLDLGELKMFDSTALGVVAGAGRTLHAAGRELYLVQPNERVALLLNLTHLDAVFPVAPTVEAALGKTSQPGN